MRYEIAIRNAKYLDGEMCVRTGDILIKDGKIRLTQLSPEDSADKIIDDSRLLWIPTFTDGHIHISQQLLRGRLLDEKPVIWKRVNVPFECRLDEEDSQLSAEIAALEMIKSGTGALVDAGGKYPEVFASVLERAGLRARLTRFSNDHAPEALRLDAAGVEESVLSIPQSGLIKPFFSITALTAASKEHIHAIFNAARRHHLPIGVHMNEYASEVMDFMEAYGGKRPFEYLEDEGLLEGVEMIAYHCLFLSEREKDIIQKRGIRVVHCPFSNCGKGVPDTPSLLSRGISVGFGSDGAGHAGLDLFKEMRLFRGVVNVTRGVAAAESSIMPAERILTMATQGGAAAMYSGLSGKIADGGAADLMGININSPILWPTHNIVHTLIESADGHDVESMIVNGRLIMENRKVLTLDEGEIMAHMAKRIEEKPHLSNWK